MSRTDKVGSKEKIGSKEVTVKFRPRKLVLPALGVVLAATALVVVLARKEPQKPTGSLTAAGRMEIKTSSGRPTSPPPPPSGSSYDEARLFGQAIAKFAGAKDEESIKELEKVLDKVKIYLPEKGPYVEAWNKAAQTVRETRGPIPPDARHDPSRKKSEIQSDMQTLLSMVSEREAAQKAKDAMALAKTKALAAKVPVSHFLFRLARYEEGNADDAFSKNDYSGAKALYRILERIYGLCPQCGDEQSCLTSLRGFIADLKKNVERLPPGRVDDWLLQYAREIESQAQGFLVRKEMDNAGGAFLRAGFLYEKIIDAAAVPAV